MPCPPLRGAEASVGRHTTGGYHTPAGAGPAAEHVDDAVESRSECGNSREVETVIVGVPAPAGGHRTRQP